MPGACSPDSVFTNCQALISSSNSNPAPLVDRSVADTRFTLPPRGAFCLVVFFDEGISFRMLVALDIEPEANKSSQALSSQKVYFFFCWPNYRNAA